MLLQDIETCRQARLVLRELIKGDKSRAQLWGSLVCIAWCAVATFIILKIVDALIGLRVTTEEEIEGLYAVCFQHELDHLNGVLFIDHLSRLRRERAVAKVKKNARLAA